MGIGFATAGFAQAPLQDGHQIDDIRGGGGMRFGDLQLLVAGPGITP